MAALVCAAACDPLGAAGREHPDLAPQVERKRAVAAVHDALIVRVDNRSALPDRELMRAQDVAAGILRSAGLEPRWIDWRARTPDPGAMEVWVVLGADDRSERMLARLGASGDLLGLALPSARRVYVFAGRIRRFAARRRRSVDDVLGHVLAHEIGHIVLPGEGHAATGIMQSDIGDAFATAWFTSAQARSIHARARPDSSVPRGITVERERSRESRATRRSRHGERRLE